MGNIPDELSAQEQLELHDIYLRLWRENNERFSALTAPSRWVKVFKEWERIRDARKNDTRSES